MFCANYRPPRFLDVPNKHAHSGSPSAVSVADNQENTTPKFLSEAGQSVGESTRDSVRNSQIEGCDPPFAEWYWCHFSEGTEWPSSDPKTSGRLG
jgi:hypothetical protein